MKSIATLQRYMNLPKFMYLLQENALFLPKMSIFEDHLEGGLTAKDYISTSNDSAAIDAALNICWPTADKSIESRNKRLEQTEAIIKKLKDNTFETPFGSYKCDDIDKTLSQCREWLYVSCWHKSPHECSAMWSLYGADKNSICIFTTEDKLLSQIKTESSNNVITLQDVKYLNHGNEYLDKSNLAPFVTKALPFSFEKELRIIYYDPGTDLNTSKINTASGKKLQIKSLSKLIDKIVVSPKADSWFFDSIQGLCSAYDMRVEIKESSLRTKRIENFNEAYEQYQHNDF
ncbi:MAG: DUF2971 domain-containing protein [Iodobacter sp.]